MWKWRIGEKMSEVNLIIHEKELNKRKEEAVKLAKEQYGGDRIDEMSFDSLNFEVEGFEFDKENGELLVYGNLEKMGWISINLEVSMDIAIEIIEFYMKKLGKLKTKLGKLKTILEASK